MSIAARQRYSTAENTRIAQLETALIGIRKAAITAQQFTNRLQYIHARADVALAGDEWDEDWKSTHGYDARNQIGAKAERIARVNSELLRALETIAEMSPGTGIALIALHAVEKARYMPDAIDA